MAKKTAPKKPARKKSPTTPPAALTRAALAKKIKTKARMIHTAASEPLKDIPGVKVHSVLYAVAPGAVMGHCDPPCGENEECLLRSSGGDVEWVCVPKS